jgi:hypothetical protein
MRVIAGLALILGPASCAEREQETGLPRWLGADPHFRAVGSLGGEDLDLDDLIGVTCALDWEVPLAHGRPQYPQGRITEMRAEGVLGDRPFALELERADLQAASPDASGLIVFETLPGDLDEAWVKASWSPTASVTVTFTVPCEEGAVEFVP